MRALVLAGTAALLLIWSAFAWIIYAVAEFTGTTAALNADLLPVPPEWVVFVSEILSGAGGIGATLVWVIWLVGAAVIAGIGAIGLLIAGRKSGASRPRDPYPVAGSGSTRSFPSASSDPVAFRRSSGGKVDAEAAVRGLVRRLRSR